MKVPYGWLKEWVDAPWDARELGARLTLAGFELETLEKTPSGEDVLELNVTPNRGDAMSIRGIAREVAALAGRPPRGPAIKPVDAQIPDSFPVHIEASDACAKFVGRVIRGVDNRKPSPQWLRDRLNAAGVRSISPVVDVTNYVMLELGTPMHAYDLAKLENRITVRMAGAGEKLKLLDGQEVEFKNSTLDERALVIADGQGVVGIAGVMGGDRTAVADTTTDVFFEVAFFKPELVGACARRQGLITDAAQRFERGVDPEAQEAALERAAQLLIESAGGRAGPMQVTAFPDKLPQRAAIALRRRQIARVIGAEIPDARIVQILESLGMTVAPRTGVTTGIGTGTGARTAEVSWLVTPPSHRFDIAIEADLIEEVARLYGYDVVPEHDARIAQVFDPVPEDTVPRVRALTILADRGYQEAITYSFVDPRLQALLFPGAEVLTLKNPIAADMAAMRVSLWPGLLRAAGENLRRQQGRVRLFESGNKFVLEQRQGRGDQSSVLREVATLAGLAAGNALPEQWGTQARPVDFFDVKADLQALLDATGSADLFKFKHDTLSCLHPGRTARLLRDGRPVGWIGELHPEMAKALDLPKDLTYGPVLFELETEVAFAAKRPVFEEISKYPSLRRDLAIVVDEGVTLEAIRASIAAVVPSLLRELRVFDIYRGEGIDSGRKSVALGLILQESSRTLADPDADRIVAEVIDRLRRDFNALIRSSK